MADASTTTRRGALKALPYFASLFAAPAVAAGPAPPIDSRRALNRMIGRHIAAIEKLLQVGDPGIRSVHRFHPDTARAVLSVEFTRNLFAYDGPGWYEVDGGRKHIRVVDLDGFAKPMVEIAADDHFGLRPQAGYVEWGSEDLRTVLARKVA